MLFSIFLNGYLNHCVTLNIIVPQLLLHFHCTSLKGTLLKITGYGQKKKKTKKKHPTSYNDGYLAQLKIYC